MRVLLIVFACAIVVTASSHKPLQAEKEPSPDDNLLTAATTTAPEINRNEYYHGLLNNCSRAQNITVEQYIYASARNNTNGVWELAKCVDECMLKTLSVMKPDGKVDMDLAMEHLLWGEPGLQRNTTKSAIENCHITGSALSIYMNNNFYLMSLLCCFFFPFCGSLHD
ncbi:uncharacterized protein LOC106649250 isoform X3 [Trichogramma pretiosum]|uniref:uncharacterized protein LOC106649250 isoform X3 n=1 Tax=Trichogramma pretiosum TaxID=7493 RepID=UPI0006C95737|nr:uncharacterized protein LOC106649250 isoform X3 [Trichogramma pretiosum]XP_014222042.1 uncharacterized protein LOC106649250 isoform X3 [Trichogramma pretiosum]XP_014222043.1 uncharacterized protein LOC106649250 isoform X3 [Trichogramma pretiosum]XP_023313973.1 uncharacterized protein LOC106649250 isoform X3 [Trichogramma pretiosum]XP_023313975.1 uncharacterized protein LOC106649250 isoform X3 [Trichogramma pretiosum]